MSIPGGRRRADLAHASGACFLFAIIAALLRNARAGGGTEADSLLLSVICLGAGFLFLALAERDAGKALRAARADQ